MLVVSTFYHFADLHDFAELRPKLIDRMTELEITGSILLAPEGINATIAGTRSAIDTFIAELRADPRMSALSTKESTAPDQPFGRVKVRLKKEIVALGRPDITPLEGVGEYVPPRAWNELISDPETLVIDTRNDFEVRIGSFEGAIEPKTRDFRQFAAWASETLSPHKDRKIAMFCTGGIRCEKATAFLLAEGYSKVYHLEGGILRYLEEVPESESLWHGDCFVFDKRVALGPGLRPGRHVMCDGCGEPYPAAESRCPRCPPVSDLPSPS